MVIVDSRVLDYSNYDWDTFDAKAFYDAGVRKAIVGSQPTWNPGRAIEALRSEGIEVIAIYDLPYFGSDESTRQPIIRAVTVASQYRVPLVFADAEIDANQTNVPEWQGIPTPTVPQRQAEFRWGMNTIKAAGLDRGVYTNGSWWKPNMGNSTEWADSKLWLATYGVGGSPIDPIQTVDFGGWSKVWAHQYTSTWQVAGRGRDCSYLFEDVKEDDMDKTEFEDFLLAVFSGDEERDLTREGRLANARYRVAQRVGKAPDGTTLGSVADNALAAIKLGVQNAQAAGMSDDDVRAIVGDVLAGSQISITPGGTK